MKNGKKRWLSHSGLEVLERCPRCFWLQYNKGIRQPEGIVSRLANRFDHVLKNYFNIYRPLGEIPPIVQGKLEGKLQDPFQEKYFADFDENYGFWGKFDECLETSSREYIPVDFKTASSDPRDKVTLSAYQSQIDDYLYLLEKNGRKTLKHGYLIYFFPDETKNPEQGFPMIVHITKLNGDPTKTEERIKKAIPVLEGTLPEPSATCPFCTWYKTIQGELKPQKPQTKNIEPIQETLL